MATDASPLVEPQLADDGDIASSGEAGGSGPASKQIEALSKSQTAVLVLAVFVAGLCSIVYELLIATASSYFLGDSIRQFSITIGIFMASMGLGSFLSRNLGERVLGTFVVVEVALGIVGGISIPVLYAVYAYTDLYTPAMMVFIGIVGTLTGLEIPILVLAMRRFLKLNVNLSTILSLDYFGALGATLLFPFALLPLLGTFKSPLVIGLLNLAVALLVLRAFKDQIEINKRIAGTIGALGGLLGLGLLLVFSGDLLRPWHEAIYEDKVLLARQSPYQKIVLTRYRNDVRLYLNGNLQFSSWDEYRYHEAIVHPAFSLAPRREQVLVLGGGDGLAAREMLKYDDTKTITIVDLDPVITEIAKTQHLVRELNGDSLASGRVTVQNEDAWVFLEGSETRWDVIVIDLPDPNDTSLARLYSREFYGLVRRHLAKDGVLVTQATSPFFASEAFWTIVATMEAAGLHTRPYHANVPSFGDWGFVLGASYPLDTSKIRVTVPARYLDDTMVSSMFDFPRDVRVADAERSTLDDPVVLGLYLKGWKRWR